MKKLLPILLFAFAAPAFAAEEPQETKYVFQLSYADAEQAIGQALTEKGAGDKISAVINGHSRGDAIFSFSKPITVEVRGLKFDKAMRNWNASLLALADGEVVTATAASGRFQEMVALPVLKREARNGDVIKEENIEWRDFPASQARSDLIADVASLTGKSPLRVISANRPIRANEIANPTMVKKNAAVQMRFLSPGMEITTMGEAMTDGAKGETIAVRNISSKKIVHAMIEDEHTVRVIAGGTETSQLNGESHVAN